MKLFFKIIVLGFFSGVVITLMVFAFPQFLSKNQKVANAEYLVVEGWIPHIGLEVAYQEFLNGKYKKIITTGSSMNNYVGLYINSYLIFHLRGSEFITSTDKLTSVIELEVASSLGKSDSAHFSIWINDLKLAEGYTFQNHGRFRFDFDNNIHELDSVMIEFDSDMIRGCDDRNLHVSSLRLNGSELISNNVPRFMDRGKPFGKHRWNVLANNYADMAEIYFLELGISKDQIISVANFDSKKRRTFGNANALYNWLIEENISYRNINVVSMDYHSYRTWLIYNRLLSTDKCEVGIISVDNIPKERYRRMEYTYIIRETIALLYYYLFILPWV